MNPVWIPVIALVVCAVLVVVANNYFHKQYAALVAQVEARLTTVVKGTAAVTQAAVKAIPAPVVPVAPVVEPPQTMNGVSTPAGLTNAQFVQLVLAKQSVATLLNPKAGVIGFVGVATDAWFAAQAPYFVQQLVAQAPAGTPAGDRARAYAATVTLEAVTPAQDAAASVAAGIQTLYLPTP